LTVIVPAVPAVIVTFSAVDPAPSKVTVVKLLPDVEGELSLAPVVAEQLVLAVKVIVKVPVVAGMVHVPHVGEVAPTAGSDIVVRVLFPPIALEA
jgi:hypothetical protein